MKGKKFGAAVQIMSQRHHAKRVERSRGLGRSASVSAVMTLTRSIIAITREEVVNLLTPRIFQIPDLSHLAPKRVKTRVDVGNLLSVMHTMARKIPLRF